MLLGRRCPGDSVARGVAGVTGNVGYRSKKASETRRLEDSGMAQ